jgi:hypothetical protein
LTVVLKSLINAVVVQVSHTKRCRSVTVCRNRSCSERLENETVANVPSFTRDDAVKLGEIAVGVIREWDRNLAVDIHIGDELAYRAQLLGRTSQATRMSSGARSSPTHYPDVCEPR